VVPLAVAWPDRFVAGHAAAATAGLVGFYLFLAPGVLVPGRLDGAALGAAGLLWVAGVAGVLALSVVWLAAVIRDGLGARRPPA